MNWGLTIDGKAQDDSFYGNHKALRAHVAPLLGTVTTVVAMSENGHVERFEGTHRYEVVVEDKSSGSEVVVARYDMVDREEAWDTFNQIADLVVYTDNTSTYVMLVEVVEGQRVMAAGSQVLAE